MPIDSSIYFRQEAPDIIGSIEKGLKMSDMIEQRNANKVEKEKQNEIKTINMSSMVNDPVSGMATYDAKKAASEMVKKGYHKEAGDVLKNQQSMDMGQAQLTAEQYKNSLSSLENHARELATVTDQASLDAVLSKYKAAGHDISKEPTVWNAQTQQYIKNEQMKTLTAKERFELANKDRDFSQKQQELVIKRGERADAKEVKVADKQDKKAQAMFEIEDRRKNINDNLDTLDTMIKDDGTWEMFGEHNQNIDRKLDQIATDMAKLMDPSSVARPSEVEQIKKGLMTPTNKNSTARQILMDFKNEVKTRADSAYNIRGLEKPPEKSTEPPPANSWSAKNKQVKN